MARFKQTIADIKDDLPGSRYSFKIFLVNYLYNPSFRVLLNHRIGKFFFKSDNFFLRQVGIYYKTRLVVKRHCDISYSASIGKHLRMPHPIGIVIGEGVLIKDNVFLFQQVTLGSHGNNKKSMDYPVIESGVKVYAGAKIIGGLNIGSNAIIGANAVVNISVPAGALAVGVPCKIIQK